MWTNIFDTKEICGWWTSFFLHGWFMFASFWCPFSFRVDAQLFHSFWCPFKWWSQLPENPIKSKPAQIPKTQHSNDSIDLYFDNWLQVKCNFWAYVWCWWPRDSIPLGSSAPRIQLILHFKWRIVRFFYLLVFLGVADNPKVISTP